MTEKSDIKPEDYFNENYLRDYFNRKIQKKKGGGRDGLTPEKFMKRYSGEIADMANHCLNGTYKFSPYKEKFILKGKNKYPRILSIPSIRDRLVLGVMNDYLQRVFPEFVNRKVPNQYITEIIKFLKEKKNIDVFFFKSDFHDFFGSLRHKRLKNVLAGRIHNKKVVDLVMCAIRTPTVGDSHLEMEGMKKRSIGVPQGLAISNILSSIYMSDFDSYFNDLTSSVFIYERYVDDILILDLEDLCEFESKFIDKIKEMGLGLKLSKDKTKYGKIGEDDVDYIGYIIHDKIIISIRPKNIQRFLNRIAKVISRLKIQFENKSLRPQLIIEDKSFVNYYIEVLNEMIAGFKMDGHIYGWIAYFQAMTDTHLLYSIDRVIRHKFMKYLPEALNDFPSKIRKLPIVYWDIRKSSGKHYVCDYDKITDIDSMKVFLTNRGRIDPRDKYDDEQIQTIFNKYKEERKKYADVSIGSVS